VKFKWIGKKRSKSWMAHPFTKEDSAHEYIIVFVTMKQEREHQNQK
jgi:hypothetical protein